jgi:uncharacterized membrane protein
LVYEPPDISIIRYQAAAGGSKGVFLNLLLLLGPRYIVAVLLAVVTFMHTPPFLRNLAAWDVFAVFYVSMTVLMMARCSPEDTLHRAQRWEPSNKLILSTTMVTAVMAMVAVAEGSMKLQGISTNMLVIHAFLSIIGVISAWFFVNINFAIHYARIYYHDENQLEDGNPATFRQGLAFPGESNIVDYWDFIYYSFTIAMCYQTSDVSITSPFMRRLTIGHAIFSFLFVLLLFGMVVNIIANVI